MAKLPFLPLATDAYLADCAHLSDAEHGRYLLLLMAVWRAPNQRLPNDDEWLARRFARPVERVQTELRPLIEEFCDCDGNWFTQKRLSKEWRRVKKIMAQRSAAAKARWRNGKAACERNTNTTCGRNELRLIPISISKDISARRARADGTRLDPDWTPSAEDREFALSLGLNPDLVGAEFKDFWLGVPGTKGKKLDWAGTFRNRCREIARRIDPRGSGLVPKLVFNN